MPEYYDIPRQLDDEMKGKLRRYLDEHDDAQEAKRSRKVSKELCDLVNEMANEGVMKTEILDFVHFSSKNTLYYHLRGDCSHELGTDLTYDECGWMRVYAHNGAPSNTLGILYDVSTDTASKHVRGKCEHEDGIEPVSKDQMWENQKKTRHSADIIEEECPVCGDTFEYKEYHTRTTCSEMCNSKYANQIKEKA